MRNKKTIKEINKAFRKLIRNAIQEDLGGIVDTVERQANEAFLLSDDDGVLEFGFSRQGKTPTMFVLFGDFSFEFPMKEFAADIIRIFDETAQTKEEIAGHLKILKDLISTLESDR